MKCLTSKQIQRQIDGEISSELSEHFQQHIDKCPSCQEQYNDQKLLAHSIKDLMNASVKLPEEIPEFGIPKTPDKIKVNYIRIPFWLKAAAVLIPVFFVWKMSFKPCEDFKPSAENIRMYEMGNSIDANTAFQENMITTKVINKDGKVIKCETN